jgi:hypothetical protein
MMGNSTYKTTDLKFAAFLVAKDKPQPRWELVREGRLQFEFPLPSQDVKSLRDAFLADPKLDLPEARVNALKYIDAYEKLKALKYL